MSGLLGKIFRSAYIIFIKPVSLSEDMRRMEFVINSLLVVSLVFLLILDLIILKQELVSPGTYSGIPFPWFSFLTVLFVGLLWLSRTGRLKTASIGLILIYSGGTIYTAINWGFDIPSVFIGSSLVIAVSSILISTRFSVIVTSLICIFIISLGVYQVDNQNPTRTWRNDPPTVDDTLYYSAMLGLITFLYWLSNKEAEKSLKRAMLSEAALKEERDLLEIKVEERTKEIKELQAEKVSELYRFAEFGRISSGAFHDLMNPLTSINLMLGEIGNGNSKNIPDVKDYLEKAIKASERMQGFINVLRKRMRHQQDKVAFIPENEIKEALVLLSYKIRKSGCDTVLTIDGQSNLLGCPISFYQIISNLVSNAVDSYSNLKKEYKPIKISARTDDNFFQVDISDEGCGMSNDVLNKVFDPFFSTKPILQGSGIGMSTTKNIVEKEFEGDISISSELNKGTSCKVVIPINDTGRKMLRDNRERTR